KARRLDEVGAGGGAVAAVHAMAAAEEPQAGIARECGHGAVEEAQSASCLTRARELQGAGAGPLRRLGKPGCRRLHEQGVGALRLALLRVQKLAQVPQRGGRAGIESESPLERRGGLAGPTSLAKEETFVVVGGRRARRSRAGRSARGLAAAHIAEGAQLRDLVG